MNETSPKTGTGFAGTAGIRDEIVALIPRLRRFARGLTRNADQADDIVQITLEKALTRSDQFNPGTRLDSWMFRILQNSWIDETRRNSKYGASVDIDSLADILPAPGEEAHNAGAQRDISIAMQALSDDQRILVMLVLVEGYSYQEAARITGVPIGTVMSRLARGRQVLMKELSGKGDLA